MHGMKNAKFVISVRSVHLDYLVLGARKPRYATGCDNLNSLVWMSLLCLFLPLRLGHRSQGQVRKLCRRNIRAWRYAFG